MADVSEKKKKMSKMSKKSQQQKTAKNAAKNAASDPINPAGTAKAIKPDSNLKVKKAAANESFSPANSSAAAEAFKPNSNINVDKADIQRNAAKLKDISTILKAVDPATPAAQDQRLMRLRQMYTELTLRLAAMIAIYGTEEKAMERNTTAVAKTQDSGMKSANGTVVQAKKRGGAGKQYW